MKYYYRSNFFVSYDPDLQLLYLTNDSSITAYSGAAVFTKSTSPLKPNFLQAVTPTGQHNNGDYVYSKSNGYANQLITFEGDYNFTLNGPNDRPTFVNFINGKYIALTRHYLYESIDKENWIEKPLPSVLDRFIFPYTYGKVIPLAQNYYGKTIVNADIHPDLNKKLFSLPSDFKFLPTVHSNNSDVFGRITPMPGYICLDGSWNPKPIDYLSYETSNGQGVYTPYIWPASKDKVQIALTDINTAVQFNYLNLHWDPTAWNAYDYAYSGNFVADYNLYQVVGCNGGYVQYRLFSDTNNNGSGSDESTLPFQTLDLETSGDVLSIIKFYFSYDYEAYNNPVSTLQLFEHRYAVTTQSIHELVWNGSSFESIRVLTGIAGEIISTQYEYRSKWTTVGWYGVLTGLPEIHRLHVYGKNGTYIVIDASDKTLEPIVALYDNGFNFIKCFYNILESKNIMVTDDNRLYLQEGYTTFSFLVQLPDEVISMSNSGDYTTVCTTKGMYYYTRSFGLGVPTNYEIFIPAEAWTNYNSKYYVEYFRGNAGALDFVNNMYIYVNGMYDIYMSSDLENWTFVAAHSLKSSSAYTGLNGGQPKWYYYEGNYVQSNNNGYYYLDLTAKTMVPGFGSSVPTMRANTVILNRKLVTTDQYEYYPIYDPAVTVSCLQSPVYNSVATDPSATQNVYTEMTRIEFTMYVDDPHIEILLEGVIAGMRVSVEVSPITGFLSSSPLVYCDISNSGSQSGLRDWYGEIEINYRSTYIGYGQWQEEYGNYVPGIKTISIIFSKLSARPTSLDLKIFSITIDGVTRNINDMGCSIVGDAWTINNNFPIQYIHKDSQVLKDLFAVSDIDFYMCFVPMLDGLYQLRFETTNYVDNALRKVFKYNTITESFLEITDVQYLEHLGRFITNSFIYSNNKKLVSINYCHYVSDVDIIASKSSVYTINTSYPLANKTNKIICFSGYDICYVGDNGFFAVYNNKWEYYKKINLDPNTNLLNAVQFSFVLDQKNVVRTLVIGTDGYVAYADSVYNTWTVNQLGTADFLDVAVRLKTTNGVGNTYYEILIVGKLGTAYYSENNGETWVKLTLSTTGDITSITKHTATSKYVISGNKFIAVSNANSLYVWNTIITGLDFNGLSAVEYSGNITVGCKDGKMIQTVDLYNWYYLVSNTAADIKSLTYALYRPQYQPAYWAIFGVLDSASILPEDLFNIGSTFYRKNGYYYDYSTGSSIYMDNYDLETITSIDGRYFLMEPMYTGTDRIELLDRLTWQDIYCPPSIKMYSDAACTVEVKNIFYRPVNYTHYVYSEVNLAKFYFDDSVDLTLIQYISMEIAIYTIAEYTNLGGYRNTWTDTAKKRYITMPITSIDTILHTVDVTGFDFQPNSGNIEIFTPIAIPYSSLYATFTEDAGKCEVLDTSIWLKAQDNSKLYDNLLATSRNALTDTSFAFKDYTSGNIGSLKAKIHNANLVSMSYTGYTIAGIKRPTETSVEFPNRLQIQFDTTLGINYLASDSKILFRGLVLDIADLSILEHDEITEYNQVGEFTGSNLTGYDVIYHYQALATVTNKYYAANTWVYTSESTSGSYSDAMLYKSSDIKTIAGTVSYAVGDTSPDGYHYVRSVTASFTELEDIRGDLMFDGFYVPDRNVNQNGTSLAGWVYVSPTLLKVWPYWEGNNYQILYKPVYRAFTGQLQYVKSSEVFDYTSEALQPLYGFTPGDLEFNLDQFPGVWKKALDLPAIIDTTPVKLNIRQSKVVGGIKYLPHNILRISGVEYII